jgi:hypothetical protein
VSAHPYRTPAEKPRNVDSEEPTNLKRLEVLLKLYVDNLSRTADEVRAICAKSATKETP